MATLARELNLAVHLLLWEYDGVALAEQASRLSSLVGVRAVEAPAPEERVVRLDSGNSYRVDLAKRLLRQEGSPTIVDASLSAFAPYRAVFDQFSSFSEEARLRGAMTYAVYAGYRYGTPVNYIVENVSDAVAHCGALGLQLHEILRHLDVKSQFVAIDARGAAHMIVQVATGEGEKFLLDPSSGFAYAFDAHRLGKDAIPEPIRMPQVRNLDFLDLRRMFKDYDPEKFKVWVYEDYLPGAVYLRPKTKVKPVNVP